MSKGFDRVRKGGDAESAVFQCVLECAERIGVIVDDGYFSDPVRLLCGTQPVKCFDEFGAINGFDQVTAGVHAGQNGFAFLRDIAGQNDNGHGGIFLLNQFEQLPAIHTRHHQIGDDEIGQFFTERLEGLLAASRCCHAISQVRK